MAEDKTISAKSERPEVLVRTADARDASAIAVLVNGAYRGDSGRRGWTTEADLIGGQRVDPDGVLELMRPGQSEFLLAVEASDPARVLGSIHVARHASGDGYFGMLAVDPAMQTGGVGALLIAAAERHARAAYGASAMRITVISVRRELIAYYERRGYLATGESEPFPYGQPRFGEPAVEGLVLATYRKPI